MICNRISTSASSCRCFLIDLIASIWCQALSIDSEVEDELIIDCHVHVLPSEIPSNLSKRSIQLVLI